MAGICCGVVGEGEATAAIEPSSRASRRRRVEQLVPLKLMADAAPQTLASPGRKRQKLVAPRRGYEKESADAVVLSDGKREEESEVFLHKNQEQSSRESPKPLEVSNEVVQVCPKYGVTSVCGRRRDMEDAVSVHGSFSNKSHFFGVFDGHGCSHVAMKCKDRLHEMVKEEVEGKGEGVEWKVTMEKSFDRMDKEVQESSGPVMGSNCRCDPQTPQCDAVGSTAVVAVVTPEKIVVANCGDSRAVLCRKGVAVPLSVDHKPDRPDELVRIQEAGGRVIYWDGARVLGVLAMSRAIGDNYLKPYVISKPEVTITDRTAEDECLILASDGLWDVVSNDVACSVARNCLRAQSPPSPPMSPGSNAAVGAASESSDKACSGASILLTKLALARHSTDNSHYCGGCKTQNLSYEAQLRAKEQQVRELVMHVGKFSCEELESLNIMKPIVPCDIQFHYRNKMEFSFGTQEWLPKELLSEKQDGSESYALGLHAPGFFDKVLNVNKCLLQSEPANMVLSAIQGCWRDPQLGISAYNVHSHAGFLKHLMLRTGRDVKTGLPELMVNFVTSSYKPELLKPLVEKISSIPEVVSVMNNVNSSIGNTSVGEEEYTLYGKSTITEILRGLTFQISANSFFQTNTHQAEVLYKLIEECAGLRGDGSEIVLDLFCGTGTIGLTLARKARQVYGYEVVSQAIADACLNAKLNNIYNATFVQGDLNKIDESFGNNFPKPDVVISDPNRPGMHMKLIKFLLKLKAPRIVYVSCNPATCARDLDYLCHGVIDKNLEGCYKLKSLQAVDMFPHTPHIECVCLLELC